MDTNSIHPEWEHGSTKLKTKGPPLARKWLTVMIGILILFGLYLSSLYSYLLFHTLVEMSSIMVAWAIFIIAWNCRRILKNNYLLLLGIAFLFIGGLDLVHALAYNGMNILRGYKADLPTQLWIAARYMESITFLMAPLFLNRRMNTDLVLMAYTLATLLVLGSVFYWHIFPTCFVEGVGLTPFKIISEYIISIILVGAIYAVFQKRKKFDERVFRLLMATIAVTIVQELAFTFYIHAYGLSNLVGHYLKIISFYLIYKAIIETGLTKPYTLMFRDLKQSEKVARKGEEKYRTLFEDSPISLWEEDFSTIKSYIDGLRDKGIHNFRTFYEEHPEHLARCVAMVKIVDVNKTTMDMYQVETKEPFLKRLDLFFIEESYEAFKEAIITLCEGKTSFEADTVTHTATGEIRHIYMKWSLAPGYEETWSKILVSIVDVTERKQAEEALNRSEEQFRAMMEAMIEPVYICSPDFRVEYINPAMIRRTGHSTTGENCFKFVNGLDEKCPWCIHHKVQQGEYPELEIVSPKDNRSYHISNSPIVHSDGIISKMAVYRDTTDRKLAEQQLESSLREKEVLLQEVHHRVKNNMQVITSLLRLQAGKIKDKHHTEIFRDAENRVRSMALIHETLYQTKDFANVDFNDYVKTISNHLFKGYSIAPDKVSLKIEIEDTSLGLDNAIPCGLIINELISNALKYAFPEDGIGEIKITLQSINDDQIELTVSDNGIGIPAEIDVEKTESLGLQLVQLLAENQLDGTLALDRDGGTAFKIRFKKP